MSKTIVKPSTAAANSNANVKNQNYSLRTQFLKTENDVNIKNEEIPGSSMHELIKIGQENNNNRPKESKGHRSSEKRHVANGSRGHIPQQVPPM